MGLNISYQEVLLKPNEIITRESTEIIEDNTEEDNPSNKNNQSLIIIDISQKNAEISTLDELLEKPSSKKTFKNHIKENDLDTAH